ncbi:multidrug transporter [Gaetbulibacter aestuarii]|uniref:Multidrug transporter n=1 Tax=Gaetbulibacter aestuarii TaxID=1502358 RepID=A0ABW7MU33_9FLAO
MKKTLILGIALITVLFSCTTDGTSDIIINNYNGSGSTDGTIFLSGNYTQDLTLDPNNTYVLNGPLIMNSGTTLTIPAGMTIKALASGASVYIAISQGAKIDAQGTASEPIVLTSNASSPAPGDWGGLILLGKAPVNSVAAGATSTSEIGSLPYGGTDATDNSGIIKYMRLEYSGGAADGSSENNGFSFYGVGNGTVVDYIESYAGKDDGAEFFGGTVNVSHYLAVLNEDDSIDWTEGFSGSITDAYVLQGPNHDKGIEADGYNSDYGNNIDPKFWANPTLTNITIIGNGSSTGGEAVRLRVGTKGTLKNIYLKGFDKGFGIHGDAGDNPTGAWVVDGSLHATDVTFDDIITKLDNQTPETFTVTDFVTNDGTATMTDVATWGAGWTRM